MAQKLSHSSPEPGPSEVPENGGLRPSLESSSGTLHDAFIENCPEIMFAKNLKGEFILANKQFRSIAGFPLQDLAKFDRDEFLTDEDGMALHPQEMQVVQNEEAIEFSTKFSRGDILHHYKILRFPIYDDQSKLVAIGSIATDVTDQVLSRHALIENQHLLRTFIESAPNAVIICESTGEISLVNKAAEATFNYSRNEMIGYALFDLIEGLTEAHFGEKLNENPPEENSGVGDTIHDRGIRLGGTSFPIEYSLAPISTAYGSLMICLLRDVSEKVLMETQLRQSQKMEAIGKLTGGLAHDFNNLLGIVIGNIALARRGVATDDTLLKRMNTALKAAERGAELTKRMLAVARKQPLQPKPVFLNAVLNELADILPQSFGANIEIELNLEEGLPAILVDESAVESMLLNLAINARDAMPQGGKLLIQTKTVTRDHIEKTLPDTKAQEERFVHISVKDNGTGMSERALSRAFEPFFTTKEKGKGSGLGLAMTYGFVKQSRGYIVLESKIGVGTCIDIYLPALSDEEAGKRKHRKNENILPLLPEAPGTVLVVDDEKELLEIAREYLEEFRFKVLTAESGAEALQILTKHSEIELLITDIVMPGGISGPTLALKTRQYRPDIGIVFTSGYPSGGIEEPSDEQLDGPLVHKPYSKEALISAAIETLAQFKAPPK